LFREHKLSPNTVNQRTRALRFFFITVLRRSWSIADTPYPKRNVRLPKVLSQQQVAKLIASATTPFHRSILMTLYATGLRRAELAQLKVTKCQFPAQHVRLLRGSVPHHFSMD
jgi:integrase/recombinase XerD